MNWKKTAAVVLAAVMSTGLLAGCGSTALDGKENLLTVNGDSVDLGVGSFYARYQQAQMYTYWGAYFGQTGMFDNVTDEESGLTYGEEMKASIIEDLTKLLVMNQHAADYDIALSDEDKTAISEAAQAYIDANDQSVLDQIGATKEDVEQLMTLQKIQSLMMDPIVADADLEIADEDVQQSSVTYVEVAIPQAGDEEDEDAEPDEDAAAKAEADAEAILEKVQAAEDPATADLGALAAEVSEDYSALTGTFSANDHSDTTLDAALVEAAAALSDGEVAAEPVISDDGQSYFIVRLDKSFDEDATASERNSEIISRKQARFDEVTDGWVEEVQDSTSLNEAAWARVTLTDAEPFALYFPETEEAEEDAAE